MKINPFAIPRDGNYLIDQLPDGQREAILLQCERVELEPGTLLCEAGSPFSHAYFPVTGTVSMIREIDDHEPVQTETIGREGMLGAALVLGINRAPQSGVVQTPCLALRMDVDRLQIALRNYPEFSRILQRYLYVAIEDLSQSTGCIRLHDVKQRLARGLLMIQDRIRADSLPMTHQLLADMLGVQRGAVTLAAIRLQREGIIRYTRGKITIVDRRALEARSCACYSASVENHTRLLS